MCGVACVLFLTPSTMLIYFKHHETRVILTTVTAMIISHWELTKNQFHSCIDEHCLEHPSVITIFWQVDLVSVAYTHTRSLTIQATYTFPTRYPLKIEQQLSNFPFTHAGKRLDQFQNTHAMKFRWVQKRVHAKPTNISLVRFSLI